MLVVVAASKSKKGATHTYTMSRNYLIESLEDIPVLYLSIPRHSLSLFSLESSLLVVLFFAFNFPIFLLSRL
jgi:hypothetical protein